MLAASLHRGRLASRDGRQLQAEQEVAADKRRRRVVPLRDDPPTGVDEDGLRNVLAGVGANPLHALRAGFHEGVGQAFEQRGAIGAGLGRLVGEVEVRVLAAVAIVARLDTAARTRQASQSQPFRFVPELRKRYRFADS